ncbi:LysR family transcriptional regulator [Yoonia sp. I 8.24]|uniref:LysR family transcriptional regulator n=1 Tax=Yoonia sp. I 8.24 TaxID=1537229 RepID=UPI001EDEF2A3|nr:LysR family transcriptional regulator [Yoonia sp. I 8.24]MCG3266537.1 LysR family transcriptional regulator [Yoonia sp. I 8.24]
MYEKRGDWENLRLFIAVARAGGLSAAAKRTGRSAATLGRRMLEVERTLNRDLFVRYDRGYELTSEGRKLLENLEEVEQRIVRLTDPVDHATRPLVKVSAGTWTTLALIARLDKIIGEPVDIQLRFLSGEEIRDIPHREVMIGFRNRRPTETNLAGRKLLRVSFAPYAATEKTIPWIKVLADTPSARWLEKTVGNDAICEVNAPRNGLDIALLGKGIALLPTFIGDAQPTLQRRGADIPELSHDQWIVSHQDDRHLPEVRRAIDRMCAVLCDRHGG